jgi:D-alanyl-D-alanine carboxypeptidase
MVGMTSILLAATMIGFPANPAEKRFGELLAAYNSRNPKRISAFVIERLDRKLLAKDSPEAWSKELWRKGAAPAPWKVSAVLRRLQKSHVVELESKDGNKLAVRIDVADAVSGKVSGIEFDPDAKHLMLLRNPELWRMRDHVKWVKSVIAKAKIPALGVGWSYAGRSTCIVEGVQKIGQKKPATTQDLWLLGSNAKSITAVLAASLVEQGKLRWDSKLGDLLTDVPMREEYKTTTVEQLMQHLGGIPQDSTLTGEYVNRIVGKEQNPLKIRAAYVRDILHRPPVGKPGERFAYSNAGYAILGHILERIAGQPFERLLADVFHKVGLRDTRVGMPGEGGMPGAPGQLSGHFVSPTGFDPGVLKGPIIHMGVPAGLGVAGKIEDQLNYANWHLEVLTGGQPGFLKSETIRRLHTPMARSTGPADYASGWALREESGMQCQTHMGSEGSFISIISVFPKERLAVVVVTNCGDEGAAIDAMRTVIREWRNAYTATVESSGETLN